MKTLWLTFKAFTVLKQIGIIIVLLLSLWATFKGIVYVHDKGVIKTYQQAVDKAQSLFIEKDIKDVKEIESDINNTPRDELNDELCNGPCETTETTLPQRVETDSLTRFRQEISSSNVGFVSQWDNWEQPEPKTLHDQVQEVLDCNYELTSDCKTFPHCCE